MQGALSASSVNVMSPIVVATVAVTSPPTVGVLGGGSFSFAAGNWSAG